MESTSFPTRVASAEELYTFIIMLCSGTQWLYVHYSGESITIKFISVELGVELHIQETTTLSEIEQAVLTGSESLIFNIVPIDDNTPYPNREVTIELQVLSIGQLPPWYTTVQTFEVL